MSQTSETLPYSQIPNPPENYTSGTVISRMIDGLGYRYYWATKNLQEKDLAFKPSEKGKSSFETLKHIYGLSETIRNTSENKPNLRPAEFDYDFEELRRLTIANLKIASENFKSLDEQTIPELRLTFKRGEQIYPYPLWNLLNGPLADAIYHTGQIVSFRRSSGNPIDAKVNVFTGINRE